MPTYQPRATEAKWQKRWLEAKLYETDLSDSKRKKYYNLVMFPYPSGDKLHIGHWYNYSPPDSWGRYMRMKGYNVFEPMGFDSFGLPAENYAIKTGVHPTVSIADNVNYMRQQLREMGGMHNFSKEVVTSEPEYYKWTQWIFLQLYKKGLAYRKNAPVNWCPSCQTVLANEQVVEGHCERCKSGVTKKDLTQWFFRIRDYAQRLLNFDGLDWPEKTKLMQQHWIGRSEGSEIYFELKGNFNFVLLHGYSATSESIFLPWMKKELTDRGYSCEIPDLPGTETPSEEAQVNHVLQTCHFDENTILFGHSLGTVVALKVLEQLKVKIAGVVLAGGFLETKFRDKKRPFDKTFNWNFDFKKIRANVGFVKILSDVNDHAIPLEQGRLLQEKLGGELFEFEAQKAHFMAEKEPEIFYHVLPQIKVFTTRCDTLFGCTYVVLAPENPLVERITQPEFCKDVEKYGEATRHKNDIERAAEGKEKTGVFTGSYAINPVNGEAVPIWIADYVLASYGTGAVMAVPAHDERDFAFAKKYELPIKNVIQPENESSSAKDSANECFTDDGILFDSGDFDGLTSEKARKEITEWLEKKSQGNLTVNYKLRDWLISRQRYWGAPIPIIFCDQCGDVPVPEKDLPVMLPLDVDFQPKGDGKSPLNTVASFVNTVCPNCGGKAKREVDTMDTFVDSSWYFLRYPSAQLKDQPFDQKLTKHWLPVDMYIGGPEHACMHLLYARFINMVLYDLKYIDFPEPFKKLVHQGMITKDGAKMSKSKGNVVSPDQFVEKYGSDVFRMYLMFMGPFTEGGDWSDKGITGIARFVEKFYLLMTGENKVTDESGLKKNLHRTIKKITEDIEKFQFNTTVAALMEFVNGAQKTGIDEESKVLATKLIAPLAPHLAEEIWEALGEKSRTEEKFSIFDQPWPEYEEKFLADTTLVLPIQVNGKLRGQISVTADLSKEEILAAARAESNVAKYLEGQKIIKEIYVQGRLVSFVVGGI